MRAQEVIRRLLEAEPYHDIYIIVDGKKLNIEDIILDNGFVKIYIESKEMGKEDF